MFRCFVAALTFVFLLVPAVADDRLADIEAIDDIVARLDEAFVQKDAEAIRSLMTKDHIAVVPYSSAPETVEQAIASLPQLEFKQTDISEPTVTMLGPDSAMRTLTARFEGSFGGEAFDNKVFITSIMKRIDGKWLESFYQVTNLAP